MDTKPNLRIHILLSLTCGCVLTAALILAFKIREAKGEAQRLLIDGKMSQLRAALLIYHEQNGCFPPNVYRHGENGPIHSWRVLLLKQLSYEDNLANYDFSKEWNSKENLSALSNMPLFAAYSANEQSNVTMFLSLGIGESWPSNKPLRAYGVTRGEDVFMIIEYPNSTIDWRAPEY